MTLQDETASNPRRPFLKMMDQDAIEKMMPEHVRVAARASRVPDVLETLKQLEAPYHRGTPCTPSNFPKRPLPTKIAGVSNSVRTDSIWHSKTTANFMGTVLSLPSTTRLAWLAKDCDPLEKDRLQRFYNKLITVDDRDEGDDWENSEETLLWHNFREMAKKFEIFSQRGINSTHFVFRHKLFNLGWVDSEDEVGMGQLAAVEADTAGIGDKFDRRLPFHGYRLLVLNGEPVFCRALSPETTRQTGMGVRSTILPLLFKDDKPVPSVDNALSAPIDTETLLQLPGYLDGENFFGDIYLQGAKLIIDNDLIPGGVYPDADTSLFEHDVTEQAKELRLECYSNVRNAIDRWWIDRDGGCKIGRTEMDQFTKLIMRDNLLTTVSSHTRLNMEDVIRMAWRTKLRQATGWSRQNAISIQEVPHLGERVCFQTNLQDGLEFGSADWVSNLLDDLDDPDLDDLFDFGAKLNPED